MTAPGEAGRHAARAAEWAAAGHEIPTAQVHALLAIYGQLAQFTEAVRVLAVMDVPHPPVPEQAATPGQAAAIEANADLWAGWQPGTWPVHDRIDPRGWRWADPLEGA